MKNPASVHVSNTVGARGSRGRKLAGSVLAGLLTASSFSLAPPATAADLYEKCGKETTFYDQPAPHHAPYPANNPQLGKVKVRLCWRMGGLASDSSRVLVQPAIKVTLCEKRNPEAPGPGSGEWRKATTCTIEGKNATVRRPGQQTEETTTFTKSAYSTPYVQYPLYSMGSALPCEDGGWQVKADPLVDVSGNGAQVSGELDYATFLACPAPT
ncbi:hypothetical protein AB0A98_22465 [Streptomyces chrestomyceticus]|uniref:hypothetical protein n=1 Tax=Streptomyces chrestomyceticus TaxID=68185 RepID=UPI00340BF3FE